MVSKRFNAILNESILWKCLKLTDCKFTDGLFKRLFTHQVQMLRLAGSCVSCHCMCVCTSQLKNSWSHRRHFMLFSVHLFSFYFRGIFFCYRSTLVDSFHRLCCRFFDCQSTDVPLMMACPAANGVLNLKYLNLTMCTLHIEDLSYLLCHCHNLRCLSLECCALSDDICCHLAHNRHMNLLNLSMCNGIHSSALFHMIRSMPK